MEKPLKELLEFGILNIDKPSGPTSFGVSDFIRKTLKPKKTSHFGTLDPKVTGVLPIALGRACKLTGFFLGHDKEYVGIMRIHEEIELEKIEEMIKKKFMGKIKQPPPLKSRVKRQEREREIKKFDLIEKEGMDILFHTTVEGGTYIRKLCDDLGKELGIGAHMLELRRVRAGVFSEEDEKFVNLYDIEKVSEEELKKLITPAEEALKKIMPSIEIRPDNIQKLYAGNKLLREEVISDMDFREGTLLAVFSKELFIGIYRVIHEGIKFARPEFVFQPVKT